eukprot:Amastigsp_a185297_15.p4 type:complete len:113 gc:universal Amastigsp_a185297_15:1051-713(-)
MRSSVRTNEKRNPMPRRSSPRGGWTTTAPGGWRAVTLDSMLLTRSSERPTDASRLWICARSCGSEGGRCGLRASALLLCPERFIEVGGVKNAASDESAESEAALCPSSRLRL